jgi:hypothetical protein
MVSFSAPHSRVNVPVKQHIIAFAVAGSGSKAISFAPD